VIWVKKNHRRSFFLIFFRKKPLFKVVNIDFFSFGKKTSQSIHP
jgi:hypothetical protein